MVEFGSLVDPFLWYPVVTLQTQLDHGSSIPPSSSEILGVISQHGLKWQAGPWQVDARKHLRSACLYVYMFACLCIVCIVCVCMSPLSLHRLAYICMYTRRCKFSCSILCLFNYINIYIMKKYVSYSTVWYALYYMIIINTIDIYIYIY